MKKRNTGPRGKSNDKVLDAKGDPQQSSDTSASADPGDAASRVKQRRNLLKTISGGSVLAAGGLFPGQWAKPVVETVLLPAHAATSPENGTTSGTTSGTTPCVAECDGVLSSITFKNNGGSKNNVTTEAEASCSDTSHGTVGSGSTITRSGGCPSGGVGATVTILVNGVCDAQFHTSCSAEIGPGTTCGDWEVTEALIDGCALPSPSDTSDACVSCD